MTRQHHLVLVGAFTCSLLLGCGTKTAADPGPASEDVDGIGMARAQVIALEAAPGKVVEAERELEHGRDIYSFDIDPGDGTGNLREVHVDAKTGEVVRVETETPSEQRRERGHDRLRAASSDG